MQKKQGTKQQTRVKDLPKKELKLKKEDLKKVKGGAITADVIIVRKLPTGIVTEACRGS